MIGGGNIFRGAGLAGGMDRVTGDHMGMLATVMNALAVQDALESRAARRACMSAIKINQVSEDYIRRRAIRHLEKGRITIFAAGTGNPFFTTDSAAALRAIEIGADCCSRPPRSTASTTRSEEESGCQALRALTYDEVLADRKVMDTTAIALCRDNRMPLQNLRHRRRPDAHDARRGDRDRRHRD